MLEERESSERFTMSGRDLSKRKAAAAAARILLLPSSKHVYLAVSPIYYWGFYFGIELSLH